MKFVSICITSLSLIASAPTRACDEPLAGATPPPAANDEVEQLARRFAELFMPIDSTIANSARISAQEFRRGVEQSEGGTALIAAQPERYRFVEQAAILALRQCLERRLPDIQILLSNRAIARFSADELRQLNAYYESDGMQAWMREVANSARPPADLVDADNNIRAVTASDLEQSARQVPLTSLTRQQQLEINSFSGTPTGLRLGAEAEELARIVAFGVTGINAQSVPVMERAVINAMAEWDARSGQSQGKGGQSQ